MAVSLIQQSTFLWRLQEIALIAELVSATSREPGREHLSPSGAFVGPSLSRSFEPTNPPSGLLWHTPAAAAAPAAAKKDHRLGRRQRRRLSELLSWGHPRLSSPAAGAAASIAYSIPSRRRPGNYPTAAAAGRRQRRRNDPTSQIMRLSAGGRGLTLFLMRPFIVENKCSR